MKILNNQEKSREEESPSMMKTIESEGPAVEIKEEKELREKIDHTLKRLKNSNSYLIRPDVPK